MTACQAPTVSGRFRIPGHAEKAVVGLDEDTWRHCLRRSGGDQVVLEDDRAEPLGQETLGLGHLGEKPAQASGFRGGLRVGAASNQVAGEPGPRLHGEEQVALGRVFVESALETESRLQREHGELRSPPQSPIPPRAGEDCVRYDLKHGRQHAVHGCRRQQTAH